MEEENLDRLYIAGQRSGCPCTPSTVVNEIVPAFSSVASQQRGWGHDSYIIIIFCNVVIKENVTKMS